MAALDEDSIQRDIYGDPEVKESLNKANATRRQKQIDGGAALFFSCDLRRYE